MRSGAGSVASASSRSPDIGENDSLESAAVGAWAQEDEPADKKQDKKKEKPEAIANEVTIGAYYLGHDSYRFGKYSGLTDKGFETTVLAQQTLGDEHFHLARYAGLRGY